MREVIAKNFESNVDFTEVPSLSAVESSEEEVSITDLLAIDDIATKLDYYENTGSVNPIELADALAIYELEPEQLEVLVEYLRGRGVEIENPATDSSALDLRPSESATTDTWQLFLTEMGRYDLLTVQEEIELARQIESGQLASSELERLRNEAELLGLPINQEALDQCNAVIANGLRAKKHMIGANLRLVVSIAKRYRSPNMTLQDLTQEGILGLTRGAEKFDWRKGFKFSTYATWWIRQAVQRGIANQGRTIRIPVHIAERVPRIRKAENHLHQELGRDPTVEEIAEYTKYSVQEIKDVKEAAEVVASTDLVIGEDGDATMLDLFNDDNAKLPEEMLSTTMEREELYQALDELPQRYKDVLLLRYGLGSGPPLTLEKIGKELGITRERVRQIQDEALTRLEGIYETKNMDSNR